MGEKVTNVTYQPLHNKKWASAIIFELDTSYGRRILHTEYCDIAVILLRECNERNHEVMRIDALMDVGLDEEVDWSGRSVKTFYEHNPRKAIAWVVDNIV